MATLASYFGLGCQTHRSLYDVRLNLEVLKYCATVLFLESSLSDIFIENSWVSVTMSDAEGAVPNIEHPNLVQRDSFDLAARGAEITRESIQTDVAIDKKVQESPNMSSSSLESHAKSSSVVILEPDEISTPSIDASLVPYFRGSDRIQLLHNGFPFQLRCTGLKVRFGISTKFADQAGLPQLNFVVDPSPSLCKVLDACDNVAHKLSLDSGSRSDWRPVVIRKGGFFIDPAVRLHIPIDLFGDISVHATEIYKKESSGANQRLILSKFYVAELSSLFVPGTFVDALFTLDPFDYQQIAGIKLPSQISAPHSLPSLGNSSSSEVKLSKVDRREAALIKFRQKRKES
ncbi:unnamed protein product [Lupinus luteus]|uniref:Uncharacterized protein n=1 Tax=Lupinus luteus TaxID=3873 RepID=A0AAV1XVS9_LUPLU